MVEWFVQSISDQNIAGSIPAEYGFTRFFFSFSISGWLPTAKCVFLSKRGGKKWNKDFVAGQKEATESCLVQDQAPQQSWSIRSALQPDRWCNSGPSTMLAYSRAIIAYGNRR